MTSIVEGLFGGSPSLPPAQNPNFVAPGLTGSFVPEANQFIVKRMPEGQAALDSLTASFRGLSSEFANLRPLVAPGFGRLTEERVRAIQDARRRSVGNLRENLARRRVLGSSFAQDATTRTEVEFAQQEERARAESFLAELGLTAQLISQQYQADVNAALAELNQLNFESSVAAQLAGQSAQLINQNLMAQLEADMANQAGAFDFLGTIIGALTFGGFF